MQENLIEVGKWIGMNLLVYIKPVIQYANAILLTIKEMAKSLALLQEQIYDIDYDKEFAQFGESIESTTGVVDELNNAMSTLLGFDTLNILGSSSNSLTSGLGVEQRILDEVKKYQMILENVKFEAKDISQRMLEWLGYTRVLNPETEQIEWHLSDGYTNLEKIRDIVIGLITFVGTSAILNKVASLSTTMETIGTTLGMTNTSLAGIASIIAVIVAGFLNIYNNVESFKQSIDNSFSDIGIQLKILWKRINDISTPIGKIWQIFSEIANNLINGIIKSVEIWLELMNGNFPAVGETIKQLFNDAGDSIARVFGFEHWQSMILKIREILIQFKNWMNEKIWKPIGNFFINMINQVILGFQDTINFFINGINTLTGVFSKFNELIGVEPIPQIQQVTFETIPALASGGIIDRPTTALMGEYPNAKSNPEIVTPENLMRQVFVESMLPIVRAISSGNQEIVSAIDDLATRPINLNGRRVSENIYNDLQKVSLRKTGYKLNYGK